MQLTEELEVLIAEAFESPKMLRETLCLAQHGLNQQLRPVAHHIVRLQALIAICDAMRPLGPDGKHGRLHTDFCGCEDKTDGGDVPANQYVARTGDGAELKTVKAPKRPKPEGEGYLAQGRAKHKLYPSAGWNSSAICGASPHWNDYVGWLGNGSDEEREKIKTLPFCGRCKRLMEK